MFNKNTYFFPHQSLQYPRLIPANTGHEIFFHDHPEMINSSASGSHYLSSSSISPNIIAPPFLDTATTFFNQDNLTGLNHHMDPNYTTTNALQRKQAVKKDRHSKINTAQGPRDRRVRLSIGIARKFFDLQEMLGFDKPSKTLDWLLTKSKAAIKELVQMKQKASGNTSTRISSPSECEVVSEEAFENASSDSRRKGKEPCNVTTNLVKESRAKARARARERTREKMCIKQLNIGGVRNTSLDQIPIRVNNREANNAGNPLMSNEVIGHHHHDLIQESIVIKRKTTAKYPAVFGLQQNHFVSRDLSSTSNYMSIPSAATYGTDNWDVCAILDQHKFINSNSSNI